MMTTLLSIDCNKKNGDYYSVKSKYQKMQDWKFSNVFDPSTIFNCNKVWENLWKVQGHQNKENETIPVKVI